LQDTAVFRANTVISNTSDSGGGGLLIHASEGVFASNIVAQNQIVSGDFGAGIHIAGGTPYIAHTTLAHNSGGDGSGIYLNDYSGSPATIVLANTILVSQTTGFFAESGSAATIDGILWYDNTTANVGESGTVTVSHEYIGSPAFVNPAGWDYHISKNSAAKDQGVNVGIDTDIDGDLRFGAPDLGADEYVYEWQLYLPVIFRE
jgi:hypothetical protein